MFISVLELFKIGIGPSSSHTLGPMIAANNFIKLIADLDLSESDTTALFVRCTLRGSLAFTGKGHATDRAVALGLHGYTPHNLTDVNIDELAAQIWHKKRIHINQGFDIGFMPDVHIVFDKGVSLPSHPNGMIFDLVNHSNQSLLSQTYFSIGGGFINTAEEIDSLQAPLKMQNYTSCQYPFSSAADMLTMAADNHLSIATMKQANELEHLSEQTLFDGIDYIWQAMQACVDKGLKEDGELPGGLSIKRRAKSLHENLQTGKNNATVNDWLCAYAMAVNEENAAGNRVVTAPTNGAAGVIPAVIYYFVHHQQGSQEQVRDFLLTASAIGGLIKHRSSISGAEVGCQGEVGSASAMAAAGLCSVLGGTPQQVENAAEIALEHHLGMTCDPVNGLVQVPCIERNGFGAIKAYTAASLALHGDGNHFMPLDSCIEAMKQTGLEMSHKFKETSLGGLAVSLTEC